MKAINIRRSSEKMQMNSRVYKILTQQENRNFIRDKVFKGNDFDKYHGFIHLAANSQQYHHIINKYYNHIRTLYILELDETKLVGIRYERNYPHFYGKLYWYHVLHSFKLIRNIDDNIISFEE